MAVFSYKDFDEKALMEDVNALNAYVFEAFDPDTVIDEKFDSYSERLGWKVLSAEDIGYHGTEGEFAEFWGENIFLHTAQVNIFGKYDAEGKLISVGINFWGTGGGGDSLGGWLHLAADGLIDIAVGVLPDGVSNGYIYTAFNQLLTCVAEFSQANGLTGRDVIVSGHSMGGMGVNSMAAGSSLGLWDGFYESSAYVATASPTQNKLDDKVLNIGTENDPVFRVLEGDSLSWDTLTVHDRPQDTCTNNLVSFNDYYTTDPFYSIANLGMWAQGHAGEWYERVIKATMNSDLYSLTNRDSTIIVAHLSDEMRTSTWVQDLNHNALQHYGPTFIIGSDKADLIAGGNGMDYLDGDAGDDTFRDAGGYNVILGGEGTDTYQIHGSTTDNSFARDNMGNLYVKDPSGGITILNSVEQIQGGFWNWFHWDELTYQVTETGLSWSTGFEAYHPTYSASAGKDSVVIAESPTAANQTSWLFGDRGNDELHGTQFDDVFLAGMGNDVMYSNGGKDSFLMMNDNFGHNTIYGFDTDDTLIFLGNSTAGNTPYYRDFLSVSGNDCIFTLNAHSSVTLVGVSLDQLQEHQFALA